MENVCPNSNVEGNVDINQRGNGWTDFRPLNTRLFTRAFGGKFGDNAR